MKKELAAAAMAAVMLAFAGCAGNEGSTGEASGISDSVGALNVTGKISEDTASEVGTESSVKSETEPVTQAVTQAEAETVTVAGKEYSVDEEYVGIDINDDSEAVTDISGLGKLKKLKRLEISCTGWGHWLDKRFDGFEALAGCETLESVTLDVLPANDEDWHVLETLPKLRYLEIYTCFGEGFDLELPSLEIFVLTTTEYSDNVTDISPIKGFTNLKSLYIDRISDGGGHYTIDGLDVLTGNETVDDIFLGMYPENNEDWHVLETMPGLKSLSLYGDVPDDFEFNIPSLEYLSILGSPNFSKLENLVNLKSLSLDASGDYTGKSDGREELLCVARLKNLVYLELDRCFFKDYSGLLESESIEQLTIKSGEPMSEDMYNKLCEKFDECDINERLIK